jgi:glutamine synthetase
MLEGVQEGRDPGPQIDGATPPESAYALPTGWLEAIDLFENSDFVNDALGEEFTRVYSAMKRQEADSFALRVSDVEHIVTARMI